MKLKKRTELIRLIAEAIPGIGRVKLVKVLHFLQAACGVKIGYKFSLYTHGPFDSKILSDLDSAVESGLVKSRLETYSSGWGYKITANPEDPEIDVGEECVAAIGRLAGDFAGLNARTMELYSTILYFFVDRENLPDEDAVIESVTSLKPHFTSDEVRQAIAELQEMEYI